VTPRAGTLVATEEIPELGLTIWTLSNGIRVFLKPTDFRNDEVLFSAWSPGGHSLVPDPRYIAAMTAAGVAVQGGVGQFSQIELEKKLAGKVVRVSPWIGTLQEGLSGSASPEDLETLFQLVHAYFVAPRRDSTAFQALKAQYRGYVENRSARPETAFGDTLQVIMAQHHFRARPWSLALLDEMDLNASMAVYRDRFADAGDFTFTFVGSFTLDQLKPLVLTYLGGLPSPGRRETWRDVGIAPPRGVVRQVVHQGLEPKGRTTIVFSGPFPYDGWRHSFELAALGQVLEIKLREVIREDLSGTYGVGVAAADERYPTPRYQFAISFGCDPLRLEELTQAVFTQIDSLQTFGPAQDYVTKVIEISKRQREVQLKENGFWVGGLTAAAWDSLDPRLLVRYPEMVDSLTVTAVQAAATRYLDRENHVQVILLPREP
jgi:zinc protease